VTNQAAVYLTGCDSLGNARRLAQALLRKRLAACVQIVRGVESHYWWQGKITRGSEWLLIIKSSIRRATAIEVELRRVHTYSVPELLRIPIAAGSRPYLNWLMKEIK
jgi:periplasmic divalent cation tolerance protein